MKDRDFAQLATSAAARTADLEARLADREAQLAEFDGLREQAALAREERERLLGTLDGERRAAATSISPCSTRWMPV